MATGGDPESCDEVPPRAVIIPSPLQPPVDPDAFQNETPAQLVQLPRFLIARYPVTVAQWRVYHRLTGARVDEESLRGEPNHPVVHVSWLDAVAYCSWLTQVLRSRARRETHTPKERCLVPQRLAKLLLEGVDTCGPWTVTLPSEEEWEKAARGVAGSIFPWGNQFDQNRANCWDEEATALKTTSAVGCFEQGASPFGVEEAVGNVLEWTRTPWLDRWQPQPATVARSTHRTVRGGSFYLSRRNIRAAYRRYGSGPDARDGDLGFRVAVAPVPEL